MALGLFILRVVVGAFFVGHGAQKLFGWFGGHGIEGTGGFLESLGYRPGRVHANLAGFSEAAGGVLLALGLFTPLAAAMVIGVMVNAIGAVHARNGLWVQDGGIEYPLVLIASAFALASAGPGSWSLDHAIGLDTSGGGWGLGALLLGLVVGGALLSTRRTEMASTTVDADVHEHRRAA